MDHHLRKIIALCISTEKSSRAIYRSFAGAATREAEKKFWQSVARDESEHLAHWRKLLEASESTYLANPFLSAETTIARLQENLETIVGIEDRVATSAAYDCKKALKTAIVLETFMLNPAFTVLFHLVGLDKTNNYSEKAYENHVWRFAEMARILLPDEDLELQSLSLRNMYYQSEELARKIEKIENLTGLIPICAWCKKIREDKDYWVSVEKYIEERSLAEFSHSICPDCAAKLK